VIAKPTDASTLWIPALAAEAGSISRVVKDQENAAEQRRDVCVFCRAQGMKCLDTKNADNSAKYIRLLKINTISSSALLSTCSMASRMCVILSSGGSGTARSKPSACSAISATRCHGSSGSARLCCKSKSVLEPILLLALPFPDSAASAGMASSAELKNSGSISMPILS
jgi:hypothetical protein